MLKKCKQFILHTCKIEEFSNAAQFYLEGDYILVPVKKE